MKPHISGKQKDKVASYAGGLLDKVNCCESSAQVNQKKKPYRARGCRGGASRKSRKKQPVNHSRQNEENDPSRVNNNSEKRKYSMQEPDEGSHNKKIANTFDKYDTKTVRNDKQNDRASTQCNTRTLSILPSGSELKVHHGSSGLITESHIEFDLVDPSRHCADSTSNTDSEQKKFLTDALHGGKTCGAQSSSVKVRSMSSTLKSDRAGNSGGGFSFFCISPRSFLSGRKTKAQRLR